MTKQELDFMIQEQSEVAKQQYTRAILEQQKNIYKVILNRKSNSTETLEIYTTATSIEKAVKKVLDALYQDKDKYAHIFYNYAVYPYGFEKSQEYKKLDERGKWFYGEKRPTALLVTGVDKLFVAETK